MKITGNMRGLLPLDLLCTTAEECTWGPNKVVFPVFPLVEKLLSHLTTYAFPRTVFLVFRFVCKGVNFCLTMGSVSETTVATLEVTVVKFAFQSMTSLSPKSGVMPDQV